MKKVIVLGTGMVGSAIAIDLSRDYSVTAVDLNYSNSKNIPPINNINYISEDISSQNKLEKTINGFDLIIGALPGFMGYKTLQNVISLGKNIVDISFFNEDPFTLDELAKQKNATAVVDCGISPGLSNIIVGYLNRKLKITKYKCFVGGLPFNKSWPYNYKAFFSPSDVIEEYTRPARLVLNGDVVVKDALSEPELIDFEEVGTLEAFNT
ncbi:MAG: saccharopine dehydrogenase C-terminal domain-containing protein, partial [Nitrososphaeraceae archaeon]|nr:saccharopine dehydrogenase C-terminal domain-containing protein [Nitrososphaeraceae archaeon]